MAKKTTLRTPKINEQGASIRFCSPWGTDTEYLNDIENDNQ